ncbi:MAG: T9SS type A sorting domain-containing protein [Saprospiraceae bacterium]|nr:T9SS type A sorting domain-containing protein [Saprospiraceae bacterium]
MRYKSINGGNSWVNISNNFPPIPATTLCVNPFNSNTLYVGADLGVWKTEDGGSTWALFNNATLPYVVIGDIHYYEPDSTIRVGTYGRGYWKIKDGEQLTTSNQEVSDEGELNLFPNPTNGMVNIHLANQKVQSVRVYNTIGEIENEYFSTEFSIENLPGGIYFILVQTDKKTYIRKIVKQ